MELNDLDTGLATGLESGPHGFDPGTEAVLELDGVSKRFGRTAAVEDLSLTVRDGEFFTLLGPSGCGKTTTLRLLAGLERPDAGEIRIDGDPVAGPGTHRRPEDRDVGLVFQDFALFPHLTVAENVAFGLRDLAEDDRADRVRQLLVLVGLEGYGDRSPSQLSGGERQRVALARSLAPRPDVLLMDEPFSNLDVRLRVEMREEVHRLLKVLGVTVVSVTHDQEEALSISDRIGVMHDGRLEQVGKPEAVFEHPASRFVASFLGQASFLTASVTDDAASTAIGAVPADRLDGYDGTGDVEILVRPDDLTASRCDPGEANGDVVYRQYDGPTFVYRVELDNGDVVHCLHNHADALDIGDRVAVTLDAEHSLTWFPAA